MHEGQTLNIGFAALLVAVSAAMLWIATPFFAPILWSVVAAILFAPANIFLLRHMPARKNLAALLTLLLIIAIVIIPAFMLGEALVQEANGLYLKLKGGQVDFGHMFQHLQHYLPRALRNMMNRYGLFDPDMLRNRLSSALASSAQTLATQAYNLGQSALGFLVMLGIMLYLTFFMIRDGDILAKRIEEAVPLSMETRRELADKFVTVIRATMKGSFIVAIVQGLIGGVIFSLLGITGALLWGVTMGIFSLLPAVGTGLVWVPVSIYLLATGATWQGLVLIFCGLFVIGLVDNVLRPILVGRDTRMPDYVVLISTLGGLEIFGFGGIVIGPVIAAIFIAVWDIFVTSRGKATSST